MIDIGWENAVRKALKAPILELADKPKKIKENSPKRDQVAASLW